MPQNISTKPVTVTHLCGNFSDADKIGNPWSSISHVETAQLPFHAYFVGTQLFDAITAGVRVGPRDVRMCNNGSHHYRDTKKKILPRTLTFFISLVTSFCSLEHAQQKLVFILYSNHIKGHCTCIHLKKKHTQTNYFIMLLTIKVHLPQFLFFLLLFTSHGH